MKCCSRPRLIYAIAIVLVIALGIVSRQVRLGNILWDKYLGDALYAVMLYLGLRWLWPRQGTVKHLVWATVLVLLIESFQLTGIPAAMRLSGSSIQKLISVALGTKFHLYDILSYLVGNAVVWAVDRKFAKR